MTWLALAPAPRALHNIRPCSQGSLPGNEVPVHSSSCHVQSYPRKGVSLNSWLTQRYFFTYFNAPVSKTFIHSSASAEKSSINEFDQSTFPPFLETMTLLLIISKSVIVVMYQTLNKGIITLASISDVNIEFR